MLYFLNGHTFEDTVNQLLNTNKNMTDLVLLCNGINEIDASGLEVLESINERLNSQCIRFHLSEVKGPVMDKLNRVEFETHLTGQIFLSHYEAMCPSTQNVRVTAKSNQPEPNSSRNGRSPASASLASFRSHPEATSRPVRKSQSSSFNS